MQHIEIVCTDFTKFADPVHKRYNELAKDELYVVNVEDIGGKYLAAFPTGTDPIYKERSTHDCCTCRQFLKNLGKVVGVGADGQILTVWDNYHEMPFPYNVVAMHLKEVVSSAPIVGVFRTKERLYGCSHSYDAEDNRWVHFHGRVGDRHFSTTPEKEIGDINSKAHVFRRGLDEIRPEDLDTVIELIDCNQLYRGEEHRPALNAFRKVQKEYQAASNKDVFVWMNLSNRATHLRNTSIGTLLVDLASGVDLDSAVRKFEAMVAPTNYKRSTSVITPRMIEEAIAKLDSLGLEQAIERRVARLDDVHVNDVLFVDRSAQPKMKGGLKDLLMQEAKSPKLDLKGSTEISADSFLSLVMPESKSISVLFENKHLGNLVTLTAPVHESTGKLFKWDNDFAWSYKGEVADAIKEKVKAAGGNVTAIFRTSLAWFNYDDLDIHVRTPRGAAICFGSKVDKFSGGRLDVDMNALGRRSRTPVENICWNDRRLLHDGVYLVRVNNYTKRETSDVGFTLQVEFDGVVSEFSYDRGLATGETVNALAITLKGGKLLSIEPGNSNVKGGGIETEAWGLKTGSLVPVDTVMMSPNHWGDQAVGNKHLIFALRGAQNPDPVRGIYNEFLRQDLNEHRKVFEVLGAKTKAEPIQDGLSGLGFSSTRKDEVTVVVDGRPYLVKL